MEQGVQLIAVVVGVLGTSGAAFFFIGKLSGRVTALEATQLTVLLEIKELRLQLNTALIAGYRMQQTSGEHER